MLFESPYVRVAAEYGTATLWLGLPGDPPNALDLARLRDIDAALAAVEQTPFLDILVVRSANPAGFCAGLRAEALASLPTPADRAAFAAAGQQVFRRLAGLTATTVAYIDGPCLGAGLELALACDHRLVLSRPTTHLGFPDGPPCFGGTARLRRLVGRRTADRLIASGETLSGREARRIGLADHAFCERRGKIELHTFLDRLECHGWRPKPVPVPTVEDAAERRAFAERPPTVAAAPALPPTLNPIPPFPAVVGLVGDDPALSRLAAEVALRGGQVVVCGSGDVVRAGIAASLARGFVTPLEADQANGRVTAGDDLTGFDRAGFVLASGPIPAGSGNVIRPRRVVAVVQETPPPSPLPRGGRGDQRKTDPTPLACGGRGEQNRGRWSGPPLPPRGRGVRGVGSSVDPPPPAGEGARGWGLRLFPLSPADPDTAATLAAWLRPFGYTVSLDPATPPAARLAA
ncbi:MAG: enoyl-CoA hydratase/isomerase family protein [Gemmataceae bacterium]|nr:enoyl-CoA hydratase/isomerase family protein [Gemmataceae bacterium]